VPLTPHENINSSALMLVFVEKPLDYLSFHAKLSKKIPRPGAVRPRRIGLRMLALECDGTDRVTAARA
jgi:hypothetical protein